MSNCPICGQTGKKAKNGDILCKLHGWITPVSVFDSIRRDFAKALNQYKQLF